ncbi:biphenyl 2,3-dioxygenase [Candidatus Pseudothioglobus singularis]|nr:bacteriorhodopsin [Candidatus Pseudothioglobus singularis]ANQ67179.1 biphenyl 2,3-dioxygenase [Candidatus Pseudothioglobus singularis]
MEGMLQAGDFVGVSFWLVSVAMVAATVFPRYEGMSVTKEWKLSMTIAGLVTLVAAIHYYYMRDYWVASVIAGSPDSPIVYRYIDWLITVPLLMIEFFIILKAVGASISTNSFWRLLVGTLVMLIGGFAGEAMLISASLGFIIGMVGWAIIIWEIFGGEASKAADANAGVKSAFNALRLIVLVGWAIYPLGYIFGYMMGSVDSGSLNIIYNLADFVNKILFGLIIWNVAVRESSDA